MLELILQSLLAILTFKGILLISVGVLLGLIFGSIPGLSGTMAVALCLPITFGMGAIDGMALLMGLYIGGVSGGLIPAILLNIPGTPASIATTFDGYPMAKKGYPGRALGIAIISSFIGGLISIIVLMMIAPPLATIAIKFGPFEYFAVCIFALTMISSLSHSSTVKGLLSCLMGMGFALIGTAPIDGYPRFTFGFTELQGGFDLLVVLIGLFAISEILGVLEKNERLTFVSVNDKFKGLGVSLASLLKQGWNLIRSSFIGIGIGIMPGIGASTSNLIAYLVAKKQSKHPEKFGTGIDDGIVASETANNSTVGGALVPLLVLGIPGDATTALLIGALTIHGLVPGPQLFQSNALVVYSLFASLIIANIIMLIYFYFGIKNFIKLLSIPKHYLYPIILMLCVVGALGVNNRFFDIWALFAFGVIGYLLLKFRFPLPHLIIGFILGPVIEVNLRRGLMQSQGDFMPFVTEPIAATFLIIAFLSIFVPMWRKFNGFKRKGSTS